MRITSVTTRVLLIAGLSAAAWAGVTPAAAHRSAPVITGVAPSEPEPAATPQRLTINGREFLARLEFTVTSPEGGTSRFKEGAIEARTDSSFQVDVPLVTRGRYSLVVMNADGGVSPAFALNVRPQPAPPGPVIERILPEQITKQPEPQSLRVQGQRFAPGLRAVVTDQTGTDLIGVAVRNVTATAFTLAVKLETAGTYSMVVVNPTGPASNVATIVVR